MHGLNPHVYATYRNILAGLVLLPFAYFLERFTLAHFLLANACDLHIYVCVCARAQNYYL